MSTDNKFVFTFRIDHIRKIHLSRMKQVHSDTFCVRQFLNTKWKLTLNVDDPPNFCALSRCTDKGPDDVTIAFKISVNSCFGNTRSQKFRMETCCGCDGLDEPLSTILRYDVCIIKCYMHLLEVSEMETECLNSSLFGPLDSLTPKVHTLLLTARKDFQRLRENMCCYPKHCFNRIRIAEDERYATCPMKDLIRLDRGSKIRLPLPSSCNCNSVFIILHKTFRDEVESVNITLGLTEKMDLFELLFYKMQVLDNGLKIPPEEGYRIFEEEPQANLFWNLGKNFKWMEMKKLEHAKLQFYVSVFNSTCIASFIEYSDTEFPVEALRILEAMCPENLAECCSPCPETEGVDSGSHEAVRLTAISMDKEDSPDDRLRQLIQSGKIEELKLGIIEDLTRKSKKAGEIFRDLFPKYLSVANVSILLSFAIWHNEKKLKECAEDFIHKNAAILHPNWKQFVNRYPLLAVETFRNIYSKYW